jgi:hypothetical protein
LFFLKVVSGLMLLSLSPAAARSQSDATVNWKNQKTATVHAFVGPTPTEYQKAIDEEKEVLRARVVLDGATTVEFYERPKDIDFYDSTIVVNRRGGAIRSYNVGELIKHQALSLARVGIVPSGDGSGMLVCEYEGSPTGGSEGFAILRFSPAGFELHTLPLTDSGKVVVFKSKPEQVEIWSALSDYVASDADPRNYATRACHLQTQEGYVCGPPKRKHRRFIPSDIFETGIEIRP